VSPSTFLNDIGHVLTPAGWVRGHLVTRQGRIEAIEGQAVPELQVLADTSTPRLLPGFVDLHVHGGGGADTMDAGPAVATLARLHARHGTTALLATTLTAPLPEIEAALRALAPHVATRPAGGARVLGVHLEGPYLSPDRLGAQPAHTRALVLDDVRSLMALAPLRLLTLAPELPEAVALIPALVALGLRVQLGHSAADYDTAAAALRAGAGSVTHLFNAMSPLHHRAPGLVGAALAHAERAELIPDLLHVHPGAIAVARRAIPALYAVTDATAAAGMADGEFRLGRQRVFKCLGGVRLADGTLAGSALTMDRAFGNLLQLGWPWPEASAACSTRAADYLGLTDRGRLAVGAWADAVWLDAADGRLQQVMCEGELIRD
jgi:N-acetylglucosamine-6-phosphate deacetylase